MCDHAPQPFEATAAAISKPPKCTLMMIRYWTLLTGHINLGCRGRHQLREHHLQHIGIAVLALGFPEVGTDGPHALAAIPVRTGGDHLAVLGVFLVSALVHLVADGALIWVPVGGPQWRRRRISECRRGLCISAV